MKVGQYLRNLSVKRQASIDRRMSHAVRSTFLETLEGRSLFTGVIDSPLVITPGQTFPEGLNLDNTEIAAFSDTVKDPIGNYNGTIDWGDGSPVTQATSVNYHPDTELYWVAGSHIYGVPGSYSITATIFDGPPGGANTSTKTSVGGPIIIYPVNDAPTGTNDSLGTIFEDSGPHTYSFGGLLSNDSAGPSGESDEDTQSLTITGVSNVVGGTAVIRGSNVIFTPTADYSGPAGFTYTLSDNGRSGPAGSVADDFKTATAIASFNIAEVNDAPTANADSLSSVAEDSGARTIPFSALVGNDSKGPSNESGQTLTVSSVSNAVGGTVSISGGNVVFTPAADFYGLASFSYTVRDNGTTNGAADLKSATSTAFFDVTLVNDAPTAVDDNLSAVAEDSGARTISFSSLLGNDSKGPVNENDQSLTIATVGAAVGGTVSLNGSNVIFTPAADFNGQASFTYTVQDNGATGSLADPKTATGTVRMDVTPVNDAPIPTDDSLGTYPEDTAAIYVTTATLLSNDAAGPANENGQLLTITGVGSAVGGTVALSGGNVVFTPAANYFGPASFTYTVQDNGQTNGAADPKSAAGTVSLTLSPVNDVPTAANIIFGTYDEDTPSITVSGASLLAGDTAGPANESDQALTITGVSNFIGGTAELVNGDVVFHPAANFNGVARFKYTVTDNGTTNGVLDPKSALGSVRLNITPVNDAPTFTLAANPTVAEDSGPQSIANFATAISAGPADEAGQTVAFTITGNSNPGLFSIAPTLSSNGTLAFTPAADASGSATISVVLKDSGGGTDTSTTQSFTITVSEANDAPTAQNDPLAAVDEDSSATTIPFSALLANDSAGPANESGQTLTITAVGSAVGGTVSLDGANVIFTPAANYNGPASFVYTVSDNGTTNGAADPKTAQATASFTINAVNDAPTFSIGAGPTVAEDSGPQSIANFATGISAGPADEAAQTVAFTVTGNTNPALFSVAPTILPSGTLAFTPAANASGSATISVVLRDNGGGSDTSTTQSFTITVTPVNDAPTAGAVPVTVTEDGIAPITLAGSDLETAAAALTYKITSLPAAGTLKANGVQVTLNQTFVGTPANLTYEPGATSDAPTNDSFTYVVTDAGQGSSPALSSAPATVSITATKAVADRTVTIDSAGVVRIGGTADNDVITIDTFKESKKDFLRVRFGNTVVSSTIPLASVQEVRAWGRQGNDVILSNVKVKTYLNGGAGNDGVGSDGVSDVIVGGTGDDILYAGTGNDVLIGGAGKDNIIGASGKDILVAGQVAPTTTLAALRQVSASWVSGGSTFTRSAAGIAFVQTVTDTDSDRVSGGSSADWFIVNNSPTDEIAGGAKSNQGDNVRYV